MGVTKSNTLLNPKRPSILALLIDDITQLSPSEQKLLWIQLNKRKLSTLAKMIDDSVAPHQLSSADIDALIQEARKNVRKKKKG